MSPARSGKVTIKDVAKSAGVSIAAVSQALHPRKESNIKINENTIKLIKETAAKLNYLPHSGARSIRSQRFGSIGYFSPKARNLVYTPYGYQHGVHEALQDSGFRMTLIRGLSAQLDQASEQIPNAFNELNLDGLIVESYSELASMIYELYKGRNFPFLYLNDRHAHDSVFVDDVRGAGILTQHVLAKGYRKIAFIHRHIAGEPAINLMHHSAVDRQTGYTQTMESNGLNSNVVTIEAASVLGRELELSDEQWNQLKGFDALIAYDDDLANCIARKCYDLRVQIPEDIGLAGFNGDYASLSAWRALTTMKIPSFEMGLTVGRMAVQRLRKNMGPLPSCKFVPLLIEGRTI